MPLTAVDLGTVWICRAMLLLVLFNASPRTDPALAAVADECAFTMADSAAACGKAARTPRRTANMIPSRMRARISDLPEQPWQSIVQRGRGVNRSFVRVSYHIRNVPVLSTIEMSPGCGCEVGFFPDPSPIFHSSVWWVNDTAIAQAEGVGGPASHVSKTAKLGAPRSSSADGNNSVRYLPAEMWAARQASSTTRLKRWPGGKGIDTQIVVSE